MAPASKADGRDERPESSNLSLSTSVTHARRTSRCARARRLASVELRRHAQDDLAEVLVGFHGAVRFGQLRERHDPIDFGA